MYLMIQPIASSNKKLKMLNATYVLSVSIITMTAVEYILKRMDEKARDTLLFECLADNKLDIAKELLNNGVKISPTLLSSQVKLGAKDTVEFLVHNDAPWIVDDHGRTPLLIAVSKNMDEIVKILLDHYFDLKGVSNMGNNALSFGLMSLGSGLKTNIIKSLFDYGIDLHSKNSYGESALDYLMEYFEPNDLPFIPEMYKLKLIKVQTELAEMRTKLSDEITNKATIQQQLLEAQTKLADERSKSATIQQQLAETQAILSEEIRNKTNIQDQLTKAQNTSPPTRRKGSRSRFNSIDE